MYTLNELAGWVWLFVSFEVAMHCTHCFIERNSERCVLICDPGSTLYLEIFAVALISHIL